ncbi:MAG: hypothetical protein AAF219_09120, partial [Myxococcota bacterium]
FDVANRKEHALWGRAAPKFACFELEVEETELRVEPDGLRFCVDDESDASKLSGCFERKGQGESKQLATDAQALVVD